MILFKEHLRFTLSHQGDADDEITSCSVKYCNYVIKLKNKCLNYWLKYTRWM